MANTMEDPGHGSSPAAWTAVAIMLIAIAIGTVFLYLEVIWMVYAAAVLLIIGLLVGWIMKKAGFGVNGHRTGGSH